MNSKSKRLLNQKSTPEQRNLRLRPVSAIHLYGGGENERLIGPELESGKDTFIVA